MSFYIAGLQKSTLLDYPNKIACIVFTQGCNFRCGYCHNPELFEKKEPAILMPAFFEFLNSRKGKLDGIVITGGEPCMQLGLTGFINAVKSLGFLVKLDTNGSYPDVLKKLLRENLLDYVAMDIKAPLDKYNEITNVDIDTEKIRESIDLIMKSGVDYEFRTTVVKSQLNFADFEKIGILIKGCKRYYLQKFTPTKTLNPKFIGEETYSNNDFEEIVKILNTNILDVEIR